MGEEEKGFVFKDRRALDEKGDLKEERPEEEPKKTETKAEQADREARRAPLPEVNFNSLIFSLSSSALLHMGEIADPYSGKKQVDLELAKHSIDTIALLQQKTKGNLTEEEGKFIDSVLADLRWRFVKTKK
ncbi:MAG: DUF1844 domain-containing protein [Desulfatiglandales bacterium]